VTCGPAGLALRPDAAGVSANVGCGKSSKRNRLCVDAPHLKTVGWLCYDHMSPDEVYHGDLARLIPLYRRVPVWPIDTPSAQR
jgi:hypothetical protein